LEARKLGPDVRVVSEEHQALREDDGPAHHEIGRRELFTQELGSA
jgi:hypothetical protein